MSYIEVVSVAFVLAVDAMTVSVTNGIKLRDCKIKDAFLMAVFFGGFQFIMPLLGYAIGERVASFVGIMAPFLACGILSFLGIRMIIEGFKNEEEEEGSSKEKLRFFELVLQAIATSIDALAVGLGFGCMAEDGCGKLMASVIIGVVAFCCSFIGAVLGKKVGNLFEKRAELAGGIILVIVGLKMVIEEFIMK